MRRVGDLLTYSPSELVTFLGSPYAAWMDRLAAERPGTLEPYQKDDQAEMLARRGYEHEARVLARLSADGRRVVTIDRQGDPVSATRAALAGEADVIYQGALSDGTFTGYSDFLVRGGSGGWEVWDAKLSRSARPSHVLQLCVHADLLRHAAGVRAETVVLALGNSEDVRLRTADFHWYYLTVRAAFLELMARFDPDVGPPDPEPNADHGPWATAAEEWFESRDHLVRVAGMRKSQIARLVAAGITTMNALAATPDQSVSGIGRDVLARLVRQARLQVASVGKERPEYEVLRPDPDMPGAGLALLPPPSPNDVFFDFEGFPLADEGLEYLFGAVTIDEGEPAFRDWWAHDETQERRAFEAFTDFAMARWRADRAMHVYHYGAYEVTALRRLMGKYGTREDEVDALLRGEVFVDLLTVVRQGLVLGEPAYSLKNVEHLYRPRREGDVTDAGASMVEYDRWIESGQSEDWRESPILKGIRDYNEADCTSTWQLAEWLRREQKSAGIAYHAAGGAEPEPEQPLSPENQARRDLSTTMLAEAETMTGERRRIHELLGHLVEFHRREDKPQWWTLFDRAAKTHEDLVEDADCLGDLRIAGKPVPEKRSWAVRYTFDADQDTSVDKGSDVRFAHDINAAAAVLEIDGDAGRVTLKIGPSARARLDSKPPEHVSLVPFSMVQTGPIRDAIQAMAERWRCGDIPRALEDFLCRRPPRVEGHAGGPLVHPGEEPVAGAIRVVSRLDRSCLVIQGPPGAGKTHTAAHVIAALLDAGKRVGITSNSHKAIENLLAACDHAAGGHLAFLKIGGDTESTLLEACAGKRFASGGAAAREAYECGLVGGTAWVFSRPEWNETLDYLFVDEAGQVSLANLVGVAASAQNLVLLGDQMQLSQPTQGTHPGESGPSLLDYYLQGEATIPDDLGLFLATTWRLHPALCEFISDAVYEGRLRPEAGTAARTVVLPKGGGGLVGKDAGIVFVATEHDGNAQASDEEVEAVGRVVAELEGRTFTDPKNRHAIALDDLLFVAPYNMQVRRLRAALGARARVGSVDKFQGQQAPVVVLSMCASPGEFGSRGSAFLLDIHRLNVAISRAQSLAVVVADPRLARALPGSIDEMRRLNLFCRLQAVGRSSYPATA